MVIPYWTCPCPQNKPKLSSLSAFLSAGSFTCKCPLQSSLPAGTLNNPQGPAPMTPPQWNFQVSLSGDLSFLSTSPTYYTFLWGHLGIEWRMCISFPAPSQQQALESDLDLSPVLPLNSCVISVKSLKFSDPASPSVKRAWWNIYLIGFVMRIKGDDASKKFSPCIAHQVCQEMLL